MNLTDLLRMSSNNLRRRKLRTFLTVLGVIIGTASIVVMVSLGLGMQKSLYTEAEQSGGLTSMEVKVKEASPNEAKKKDQKLMQITDDVVEQFRSAAHVKSVNPVLKISGVLTKGDNTAEIELTGMTGESLASQNLPIVTGKLPAEQEGGLQILPGNMVASSFHGKNEEVNMYMMDEGTTEPRVDWMKDNVFFSLPASEGSSAAGTTGGSSSGTSSSERGTSSEGTSGNAQDAIKAAAGGSGRKTLAVASGTLKGAAKDWTRYGNDVYCDLPSLIKVLKSQSRNGVMPGQPKMKNGKAYPYMVYTSAKVMVDDPEEVENVIRHFQSLGYEVQSNMEFINSTKKQSAMIQGVLGAIGAVSLLVAAIGIANTMMMSIYERTKEIGVIKVLGCGLGNIRQMFLMEAAFIGLLGGISGIILSYLMSVIINMLAGNAGASMGISGNISYIPVWLALAGMGFSVLIGMIAGYFPALRAMKLSPLAAMNS